MSDEIPQDDDAARFRDFCAAYADPHYLGWVVAATGYRMIAHVANGTGLVTRMTAIDEDEAIRLHKAAVDLGAFLGTLEHVPHRWIVGRIANVVVVSSEPLSASQEGPPA